MKKLRIVAVFAVLLTVLLCLTGCQSNEGKYKKAQDLIAAGKYEEAIGILDELGNYEDSSRLSMYAKAIQIAEEGDYDTAIKTFQSLGNFRDSEMMVTYYTGRKAEDGVYASSGWIDGNKWFEAIEIYESIPLFRDCRERAEACKEAAYNSAVFEGDRGDTVFACSIMKRLGSYNDAPKQFAYYDAKASLKAGKYREASDKFSKIPGFRDADAQATAVMEEGYNAAAALEEAGKLDEANQLFLSLGDYRDAPERAYKLYYDAGLRYRQNGEWDQARAAFGKAGSYKGAKMQIPETTYQEAEALEAAGDREGAYKLFMSLGDYKDSFERANKPYYDLGMQKREAQDWDGAAEAFEHAGEYSDAETQIKETRYMQAASLTEAGDYDGAYAIYAALSGYKDVDDLIRNDKNLAAVAREAKRRLFQTHGSIVTFGVYPQTEAGTDRTPVEWIVLDYDSANHRVLLLSRYGLDAKPYNEGKTDITWEECTLRMWLNEDFLKSAFSTEEQNAILVTDVDNSSGQGYSKWNTNGGNNTRDRIFLLSCAEANGYLGVTSDKEGNLKSRAAPTAYAIGREAYTNSSYKTEKGEAAGWWWLRSPGKNLHNAAYVYYDGSLFYYYVNFDGGCVRPALWIDLESDIF